MKDVSEKSGREEISGLEEYNLRKKKKVIWTAIVCVLAVLMIVGVDFALRRQGRAMEKRTLACSYTPHNHSESSCSQDENGKWTCGKADYVIHQHNADCYEDGNLVCKLDERDGTPHTHGDNCYSEGELVCGLLELYKHTHGVECFKTVEVASSTESQSSTQQPSTESQSSTQQPSTESQSSTQQPSTESQSSTQQPSTESQSSTQQPSTENQSSTQQPSTENPDPTQQPGTDNGGVTDTTNPEPTYTQTSKVYTDTENRIRIEVSYRKEEKVLPDDAEMVVKKLGGNDYREALAEAEDALEDTLDKKFDPGALAYDISFMRNGEEIEPNGKVTVTFHFIDGSYEDGDDLTIIHLGDTETEIHPSVEVTDGKSTIGVESFSVYVVGPTRPVDARDISDSVKNIEFYTREGSIWVKKNKDANGQYSFNSDDSIKAVFLCESIPESELGSGAYIPLPKSISLPVQMIGETVTYNDKDYEAYGAAGTYQLLYDTDGAPCAFFQFTDDYLKWIRKNRGGRIKELYFDFEFTWDVGQTDGTEKEEKIYLGGFDGTVKIKTKDQSNDSNQKHGYNASKNIKETKYENGKMIITYEVYVNVEKRQEKAIVLKDTISWGTEFGNFAWEYSGKGGSHADDYVKLTRVSDTEKTITIGNQDGVDEGNYTIRYTASFDVGELVNAKVDSVKNMIDYGDDSYQPSVETDTRMNPMSKSGSVETVNTGEVKWTVKINDGKVPYTFGQGESFVDTLPVGTSLVEDTMKITRYDENWKEIGSVTDWHTEKRQDGTTLITVKLPQGAYRYQIEYVTKQDEAPEPGVETKVVNKAELKGDVDYETSADVTLKPDALTKTMGEVLTKSGQYYTTPDGTKRQVFEIAWSVMLASVKGGEEYTDRGLDANWVAPLIMSPEQIGAIVVKCGEKPLAAGTDYIITPPDGSENFLFKIKFLKDQKQKVTIDYTCYADITNITEDGFNVRNVFGNVEAGGWIEKKFHSTSNNLFKYVNGSDANESNRYTESKIAIGMNKTLNWVIVAEPKCIPKSPFVFKDTLPKGLRFVDGSLKIKADWATVGAEYYQLEIEKGADGNEVITLTVDLTGKKVEWHDYSTETLTRLEITYDTLITDTDFLTGDDQSKVYTNTVSWDGNDVEQNVTVTRDVIGKNGSFDEETGMLKYSVIINPDGSDLNPSGDLLRVEDTLTNRRGVEFRLDGVKLYRLTGASDGSGKKVPGEEMATLKQLSSKPSDGSAQENTYYYDESNCTITAFIPDETGCALVYGYQVMSDLAEDIYVSNKASLYGGSKSYGSTEETTKVLKFSLKAGVTTQGVGLRLEKRDAAYYEKLLAGAEFEVSRWDEAERMWIVDEENNPYITDANGSVAVSSLAIDVVYKVAETKAPENYEIDPKARYFAFTKNPDLLSIPDGVGREEIILYQYGSDIPVSVMEWKDNRQRTKLLVEKKWVDGSQNEIERINGVLTFDLYRKKVPKAQMPDNTDGRVSIYTLTDADLEQIKTDYEGYKAAHAEEFLMEYTLDTSQTNGVWRLLIPDLEQMDVTGDTVYQYYLVETSVDTLSGNDQWLKAEYAETFDENENLGGITITNTIVSEYALPETGGRGPWTDKIAGWFQKRYQNIVHYFRKEEKGR